MNLDEYKGLNRDNDQSYYYFMNENLFSKVNIDRNRTFLPDGTEPDSKKACDAYNQIIHSVGGVDMQLLGLGHNGHIGFNEPGIAFEKETHCVKLTERTIKANSVSLFLRMMFRRKLTRWASRRLCLHIGFW